MTSSERMVFLFEHKHLIDQVTDSYVLGLVISFLIYSFFCKDH
jgi:hypothetical protein